MIGPTAAGKTVILSKLLSDFKLHFSADPVGILLCVNQKTDIHRQLEQRIPQVTIHLGLPSGQVLDSFLALHGVKAICLDDLFQSMIESTIINDLFLVRAHHANCIVIYTSQYLYMPGKFSRSLALNSHIYILLYTPRSFHQVQIFSRQLFGTTQQYSSFMEIYKKYLLDRPYEYIVINCHPATPYLFRLSTRIFKSELTILFQMTA